MKNHYFFITMFVFYTNFLKINKKNKIMKNIRRFFMLYEK